MCSLSIMPADYEMLISHSPPVFSHSPPSSFLGGYAPYQRFYRDLPAYHRLAFHSEEDYGGCISTPPSPRRPCLVTDHTAPPDSRHKKRVVFADDRGMSLTHVRVMTEPSSVPPVWSSRFLAHLTNGLSAEVSPEPWEVKFPQPASDYVDFRKRLDTANVSLENVIVRESEECALGTVKVRNIAYDKVRWL